MHITGTIWTLKPATYRPVNIDRKKFVLKLFWDALKNGITPGVYGVTGTHTADCHCARIHYDWTWLVRRTFGGGGVDFDFD